MTGKKTIMPIDVFNAIDEIGMGFMRKQLEEEFESSSLLYAVVTSTSRGYPRTLKSRRNC